MCNSWWMYNVSLCDRKSSADLRNELSVANMVDVLHQTKLRWFWHVETIGIEKPVSNCGFI